MFHGQRLKSATSDYDQRHVIAFRPISAAACSWSYDKINCCISTFHDPPNGSWQKVCRMPKSRWFSPVLRTATRQKILKKPVVGFFPFLVALSSCRSACCSARKLAANEPTARSHQSNKSHSGLKLSSYAWNLALHSNTQHQHHHHHGSATHSLIRSPAGSTSIIEQLCLPRSKFSDTSSQIVIKLIMNAAKRKMRRKPTNDPSNERMYRCPTLNSEHFRVYWFVVATRPDTRYKLYLETQTEKASCQTTAHIIRHCCGVLWFGRHHTSVRT